MPTSDKQNKILRGAKGSTELGFKIFPLVQSGKMPAFKGWQQGGTKNWEHAERYLSKGNFNYGILTGASSMVFVLDADGPEGAVSLALLETVFGQLPVTLKVNTPHGSHYYFRTGLNAIPNSVGKIADHIDVRGDGGYVVGPGSSTPDGVYAFAPGCGPEEVPIAAAPRWLIARAEKKESEKSREPLPPRRIPLLLRRRARRWAEVGFARELDRLRKAPLHQRNNTLNLCAFRAGCRFPSRTDPGFPLRTDPA